MASFLHEITRADFYLFLIVPYFSKVNFYQIGTFIKKKKILPFHYFQLFSEPKHKSNCPEVALYGAEQCAEYLATLKATLINQQPYLIKGYTIKKLAEDTGISAHHLSCLINKEFKMNFQNFINHQRIEYVKSQIKLQEWKKLSLEGIAWKAGFSSRTTFFRAFVKNTGQAPSSYLSYLNND